MHESIEQGAGLDLGSPIWHRARLHWLNTRPLAVVLRQLDSGDLHMVLWT